MDAAAPGQWKHTATTATGDLASEQYKEQLQQVQRLFEKSSQLAGNRDADLHPLKAEAGYFEDLPIKALTTSGTYPFDSMKGWTAIVGGASRGIGYSIAIRMARAGANVVVLSRSAKGVSYGPGSVESAVNDINSAGGVGLGIACDLTSAESIRNAVQEILKTFERIDVLVNNASSHFEQSTEKLDERRFDSMMNVGPRGAYLLTAEVLPHMAHSFNPHVLTIAPANQFHPPYMNYPSVAYACAKFSMGTLAMGFAASYPHVNFNILWPHWAVVSHATDTFARKAGGEFDDSYLRKLVHPTLMADAAYRIVTSDCHSTAWMDSDVLERMGVCDLRPYFIFPEEQKEDDLGLDYFVGAAHCEPRQPATFPPHSLDGLRGARLLIVGSGQFAAALKTAAEEAGMQVTVTESFTGAEGCARAKEFAKQLATKCVPTGVGGICRRALHVVFHPHRWTSLDAVVFADDLDGDCAPLSSGAVPLAPKKDISTKAKPRAPALNAVNAAQYWEASFGPHCKGVFFTLQAVLPLLQTAEHPRIVHVTPPPLCEPDMFKKDIPQAVCKHIQAMYVVGHAVEFEGKIQSNGIWPGKGGGKLNPKDCLKLLACTDYAASGNFYAAKEGGTVDPPAAYTPFGSHRGHPMTRFAGKESMLIDAAFAYAQERS